jgi:hypothetical protein
MADHQTRACGDSKHKTCYCAQIILNSSTGKELMISEIVASLGCLLELPGPCCLELLKSDRSAIPMRSCSVSETCRRTRPNHLHFLELTHKMRITKTLSSFTGRLPKRSPKSGLSAHTIGTGGGNSLEG